MKDWPTVRASDGPSPGVGSSSEGSAPLSYVVREPWPTVTVNGNYNPEGSSERSGNGLGTEVTNWTTPNARDWKSTSPATKDNTRPLSEQVGGERVPGPLSPGWTEALMGLPYGWTDPTNEAPTPFPDWPMGRGPDQYEWEPTRTVPARSCADRQERIEALGDAVVPQCAEIAARRVLAHLEGRIRGPSQSSMFGAMK